MSSFVKWIGVIRNFDQDNIVCIWKKKEKEKCVHDKNEKRRKRKRKKNPKIE